MSDLFKNAVQSIILGLEDYQTNDAERTLSAVRNYYAGLLLLAKEVLVRAVPDADESEILAANYKPVPDGSGGVKYVPQSKRSIDLNGIGTRFKDFGLSIDQRVLLELSEIRNAVEHRSPKSMAHSMRQSIAMSFPLVYKLFRKANEDPYEVLEHTWQAMLDVRTVYDEELKTCRATFSNIEWNSSILADAPRLCVECGSELVAQNNHQNSNMQQIEANCRSCGATIGAERLIEYSIAKHMDGQPITSVRFGGHAPLQDCPECSLLAYVVGSGDDGCVWCECKLVVGQPDRDACYSGSRVITFTLGGDESEILRDPPQRGRTGRIDQLGRDRTGGRLPAAECADPAVGRPGGTRTWTTRH